MITAFSNPLAVDNSSTLALTAGALPYTFPSLTIGTSGAATLHVTGSGASLAITGPTTLNALSTLNLDAGVSMSVVAGVSGPGGLTKSGAGTLVLADSTSTGNSYSGDTTISAGTVWISNTVGSATGTGNVFVNGGVLAGPGTIGPNPGNKLVVNSGGHLAPAPSPTGYGTLTVLGDAALNNGANLDLNFTGAGAGLNDVVAVSGNLSLSGSIYVNPSFPNGFQVGTFPFLTYGGSLTNSATFELPPIGFTLVHSGNQFEVTTSLVNAVWTGNTSGSWDFSTTGNWNQPVPYLYYQPAVFPDTVGNKSVVVQAAGVTPGTVTFTNNTTSYSFTNNSGTLGIGGALTTVTLNGSGTAAFNSPNSYGGGTFLNAGKLVIGDDSALGAVPSSPATNVTFAGGTLSFAGASNPTVNANRSIVLNGGGTFEVQQAANTATIAGQISDGTSSGTLTTTGPGTLSLTNAGNSYTGGTVVNMGTLVAGAAGSLGTGPITLNGGALQVSGGPLGLVHRWSFDNSLTDSVGGVSAILYGNATLGANQVTITGNGSSHVNYVALGNGTTNLLPTTNSPYTIECWATENQVENWSRLWDFGSTAGGVSNLLWSWTQGTNNPSVISPNGQNFNAATFNTGTEYHTALVVTPNGSGSNISWYQYTDNGTLVASGNDPNNPVAWNISQLTQTNMWLGRSEYGDADANASYNEVRIWDAALTQAQLTSLTLLGPDANLNGAFNNAVTVTAPSSLNVSGVATFPSLALNSTLNLTGSGSVSFGTTTVPGGNGAFALASGFNNNGASLGALNMGAGTLHITSGPGTASFSPVTIAGSPTFDVQGANVMTVDSVGPAGVGGFIKTGLGTLNVTGTGVYDGPTVIKQGTLAPASPAAVGAGPIVLSGGMLSVSAAILPPVTSGLIQELDASQLTPGNISSWADLSGNGNGLNNGPGATVVANGMNGLNVVHFNGSQYLYSSFNDTNTQYTILTVAEMNNTQNSRLIGAANSNVLIGWWGGHSDELYLNGWVDQANSAVNTATQMYTVTNNGSTATFYNLANSLTALTPVNPDNPPGVSPLYQLELGGYNQGNELSQGNVAEVDVFNRVLSPDELAEMQAYLQAKWMGIGTNLSNSYSNALSVTAESTLNLAGQGEASFPSLALGSTLHLTGSGVASFGATTLPSGVGTLDFLSGGSGKFGALTMTAGSLHMTGGPATASFSPVTIASSPTFDVQGSNVMNLDTITGTGGFIKTGPGTMNVTGAGATTAPPPSNKAPWRPLRRQRRRGPHRPQRRQARTHGPCAGTRGQLLRPQYPQFPAPL